MIVIRVMFRIRPGTEAAFREVIADDVQKARQLPGCLQFGVFADPSDERAFLLYEEWASQADFDAYKQSETFRSNGEKIFPLMDGKPSASYFSAELIEQH